MAAKTWDNGSGDGLWSTGTNWSDNAVPATTDALTFDGTSVASCTIDNVGTWSGGTITVAAAYTGNITQNVAMVIVGPLNFGNSGVFTITWTMNADMQISSTGFAVNGHGVLNRVSGAIIGAVFVAGNGVCNLGVDPIIGSMTTNNASVVTSTGELTVTIGGLNIVNGTVWDTSGVTRLNLFNSGVGGQTITIGNAETSLSGVPIYATGGGGVTFTGAPYTFIVASVAKSTTNGGVTISAATIVDFGANMSFSSNALTVNGEMIASGTFTYTVTSGIFTVGATGVVSGGLTAITLNFSLTINAAATFPAGVSLNINVSNPTTLTITATAHTFGTCTLTGSGGGMLTIAAGTSITMAANQTGGATGVFTVTGTLSLLGDLTLAGALTTSAGSVLSGTGVITCTNGSFTMNATGTVADTIGVHMLITSVTARTFAGAGKTYANFRRSGSGTGALTITGTNTFLGAFSDNDAQAAHTIVFPNVTTTAGGFFVKGNSGKLVTLQRTGGAGTFTLTTTGGVNIDQVNFISVSNSVVDAAPVWYAGANSTNGGGNTNWIFTAPPNAGLQRRSAQMVM